MKNRFESRAPEQSENYNPDVTCKSFVVGDLLTTHTNDGVFLWLGWLQEVKIVTHLTGSGHSVVDCVLFDARHQTVQFVSSTLVGSLFIKS